MDGRRPEGGKAGNLEGWKAGRPGGGGGGTIIGRRGGPGGISGQGVAAGGRTRGRARQEVWVEAYAAEDQVAAVAAQRDERRCRQKWSRKRQARKNLCCQYGTGESRQCDQAARGAVQSGHEPRSV